ncbi:hypothetical protein DY000_02022171 [Brassica cretica]|uniref:Uncharacterized protein n=1 Tax=Brassica cretica TaxID=69181 RepID=A0ABQ7EH11_BRACR|nr:hypothetical protein DY000_02022171 [Brassica cretica]
MHVQNVNRGCGARGRGNRSGRGDRGRGNRGRQGYDKVFGVGVGVNENMLLFVL